MSDSSHDVFSQQRTGLVSKGMRLFKLTIRSNTVPEPLARQTLRWFIAKLVRDEPNKVRDLECVVYIYPIRV